MNNPTKKTHIILTLIIPPKKTNIHIITSKMILTLHQGPLVAPTPRGRNRPRTIPRRLSHREAFRKSWYPKNGWFIVEKPI